MARAVAAGTAASKKIQACAPAPERETSRWAGTPWSRQAVWLNPGAGQSVGKLTATRAIATRHSGCFP